MAAPYPGREPSRAAGNASGRVRLRDLAPHFRDSVLGACVGVAQLRPIVGYFTGADPAGSSDFEIHYLAAQLASDDVDAADVLHEALDAGCADVLAEAAGLDGLAALSGLWNSARGTARAVRAYWAVLSHAGATDALRLRLFGEMHGLMFHGAPTQPAAQPADEDPGRAPRKL